MSESDSVEKGREFRRFAFRANAVGAAGRIIRVDPLKDLNHVFPVNAASSLPVIGGESVSIADRAYSLKTMEPRPAELFYVGYSKTFASGFECSKDTWKTVVISEVRDVHVLGSKITIDQIYLELTKTQTLGGPAKIAPGAKCEIRGMALDGKCVEVTLNLAPFRKAPTADGLRKMMSDDPKLCQSACISQGCSTSPHRIDEYHIVSSITFPNGKPDGVEMDRRAPNCIRWKNVGRIYLGELLVSDNSKRLTMFRARLGSPIEGEMMAGEVEGDGHTVP